MHKNTPLDSRYLSVEIRIHVTQIQLQDDIAV